MRMFKFLVSGTVRRRAAGFSVTSIWTFSLRRANMEALPISIYRRYLYSPLCSDNAFEQIRF
jgi:hypothetical protein